MEGKTIDSLCEDVMLNIFEYLGSTDLKSATLVCKRWNDIIGNHVSTMRNLPLIFDEINKEEVNPGLNRKYHTIKLNRLQLDDDLIENIVKHLTYVKCFEIVWIKLNANQFIKIFNSLKMCSNLTMTLLVIVFCDNHKSYVYNISGFCVKNLEQLPLNIIPDEFVAILLNIGFVGCFDSSYDEFEFLSD